MRFELGGTMVPSGPSGPGNPTNPPRLVLTYTADDSFLGADYQDAGYTNYDVLCIGAGGGGGGAIDKYIDVVNGRLTTLYDNGNITEYTYTKCTGGAGGGGGIQIVSGLLVALPDSCPIVVGQGGTAGADVPGGDATKPDGTNWQAPAAAAGDGGDGGASSFNDTTCQASGGKGGKGATTTTPTGGGFISSGLTAGGGDGGIGGTTTVGGGGRGGVQWTGITGGYPEHNAVPGSWDPSTKIGSGGGGGAGGYGPMVEGGGVDALDSYYYGATDGAGGAYNVVDLSVYSPGSLHGLEATQHDVTDLITGTLHPAMGIIPGSGGGAKATLLNRLSTTYGDSQVTSSQTPPFALPGKDGVVIVVLTTK